MNKRFIGILVIGLLLFGNIGVYASEVYNNDDWGWFLNLFIELPENVYNTLLSFTQVISGEQSNGETYLILDDDYVNEAGTEQIKKAGDDLEFLGLMYEREAVWRYVYPREASYWRASDGNIVQCIPNPDGAGFYTMKCFRI